MTRRKIVIVGAGGFAREVRWLIQEMEREAPGSWDVLGFVVSDQARLGARDSRESVIGDLSFLRENRDAFSALAIGIGTPAVRLRLAAELEAADFGPAWWPALVHPSVKLDRASCELGHGSIVCAGAIATVNVRLAPFAAVNLSCTLGHEARVGRGCVLNPSVNVSGEVELGDGVLVGTGAQILQGLNVGAGATIGAGAVLTRDAGAGETWVGVPARPMGAKPADARR